MEYRNLFLEKTEDELKELYHQYNEWCSTGILGDNELGEIRDSYVSMAFNVPLTMVGPMSRFSTS